MEFQFDAQREIYDDFPKVTCLGCNSGACKNPKLLGLHIHKYSKTRYKIWARASPSFQFKWVLISDSETMSKTIIEKMK